MLGCRALSIGVKLQAYRSFIGCISDPQPLEPWEGIHDATSEGNESPQIDDTINSYTGDENCLFLNVYTPKLDSSLPVMVYVPGGGLLGGSGNTHLYGPDYLVEKDVVVVTMNYRLGALGFLSLNTLDVPGNAGLKDVVQALRWVKKNVADFGGDPANLTLFGHSAGGAIVSMLTASPMTNNLISRAIIQSGTALPSWFNQRNPIDLARKLAKALGCETENVDDILKFLISVPAKDIVEAQKAMCSFDDVVENPPDIFAMVVEREFPGVQAITTEPLIDLVTSGRVAQVPIIIGSTSLEFGLERKSEDLQPFIPKELNIQKQTEVSMAIAEKIKKLYFKGNEESQVLEYCQLVSDKFMNIDTHRYIQYLLLSTNIPIYFYKFNYVGKLNISDKFLASVIQNQPMHSDDLGYLFKNHFQKDVEPTPQDLKMRERMVRLWTNFAKTGNPTPAKNDIIPVTWLPAVKGNEHYLYLGQELSLGSNYNIEKMGFWDGLYEKYYKSWEQLPYNPIEAITTSSKTTETVESVTSSGKISSGLVEISSHLVELVETASENIALIAEEAPKLDEPIKEADKSQRNGKRSSNEMVPNSSSVLIDIIRAHDVPENDLPKNTGVNKFVDFFESLGEKK